MPLPQLKDSEKKNTISILKLYNLLPPFFKECPNSTSKNET